SELWKECSDSLFIASNPVPVKALLHHNGWIKTPLMKAPLHHRDLKDIAPLARAHDSIASWYKDQQ
ncbi:MAG: 4-hydroxy-tetrahydrodipicolinate synthase, partial [Pseudomonadota bacterium]